MESLGGWTWLRAEASAATTFRNSWWMLAAPWRHETLRGWWMVATDWRLQRPVRQWGCLPCVSERVVEFALRCVMFLPLLSCSFTLSRVFPSLLSRSFTLSLVLTRSLPCSLTLFLHCSPSLSLSLVPFLFCTLNALVKLFFRECLHDFWNEVITNTLWENVCFYCSRSVTCMKKLLFWAAA